MKWSILFIAIFSILGCRNISYQPAQTALDAAREFKMACLQGDFDKAKFYCNSSNVAIQKLQLLETQYGALSSTQVKQYQKASLQIHQIENINNTQTQIIVSTSVNKQLDTLQIMQQNNFWIVTFAK